MAIAGSLEVQIFAGVARIQSDMKNINGIVGRGMKQVESAVNQAKGVLAALGVGFSAYIIVQKVNTIIDSMEKLGDASEKTGTSVEELSKLQFLANISGSSLEGVTGALVKLSKGMSEGDKETGKFSQALSFLGLSAKDSAGNMKDPAALYGEIAKKLFDYKDGAGKAAIAMALMGKSGAEQLPVMKKMIEMGEIEASVTKEQQQNAEDYTTQLALLNRSKQILWNTVVGALLPTMKDFVSLLLDASKKTDSLGNSAKNLAADKSIENWADGAAIAVAGLIDAIKILPALLQVVQRGALDAISISAVVNEAVIETGTAVLKGPVWLAIDAARGKDAFAKTKEAWALSKQIGADSLKFYKGVLDSEVDATRKAMQAKIDARKAAEHGPQQGNKNLNFSLGDPAKAAAELKLYEGAVRQLEEQLGKLNHQTELEKINFAMFGRDIELVDGSTRHLAGSLEKLTAEHKKMLPILAATIDVKKQEIEINKAWLESSKEIIKEEERRGAIVSDFAIAQSEALKDLQFQIELQKIQAPLAEAGLLSKENELALTSKISLAVEKATEIRKIDLDTQKKILALGPEINADYEEQAQKLRDLGEASKANIVAGLATKSNLKLLTDLHKVAVDEIGDLWRRGAQASESAMSDLFFDVMQGKLSDFGSRFKATIDRMVADELAAQASIQLFGKNKGMAGGLVGKALEYFGLNGSLPAGKMGIAEIPEIYAAANGADWMVGGSGGTDSKIAQFKVTPNERIIVQTPEQQAKAGNVININVNQSFPANTNRATMAQAAAEANRALQNGARNL